MVALRRTPVPRAIGVAAVSLGVMVFFMIPTPIAMIEFGFSENTTSDFVRWHIVAMFAPSFATGFLISRFGAQTIATIGMVIMIIAAVTAASGILGMHFYGSLIILGIGWNFGFVGATKMRSSTVKKAAVQGINDKVIALVFTTCAVVARLVVYSFGWLVPTLVSGAVVFVVLAFVAIDRRATV